MGNAHIQMDESESYLDELKPGTKLLHGQYTINCFLNSGGFGITYLATNSLDRKVVIKECFPSSFCHRSRAIVQARSDAHISELEAIVALFIQEARSLAKLDHPNIVGVHEVFEENQTAYMVLDFVEGRDLLDTLDDPDHGLTGLQVQGILRDVLGAVQYIHDRGILHRDISPDNILLDADMRPVLIDFGAAREEASKQTRVLSALRVVKDGYSPQEFYVQGSPQTPSSDLYALAASFYHLIDGELPPNSQARLAAIAAGEKDTYEPLVDRIKGFDRKFLASIDKALAILPKDRLQSADEWVEMLDKSRRLSRVPTQNAPLSSAAAATLEAQRKPSLMPLLSSVAAVALLAVGGLYLAGYLPAGSGAEETAQAPIETLEPSPSVLEAAPEALSVETAEATPAIEWTELQSVDAATRFAAAEQIRNAEAASQVAIAQAEAETEARLAEEAAAAELAAAQEAEAAELAAAEAEAEAARLAAAEAEAAAEAQRQAELAEAEAAAEAERLAAAEAEAAAAAEAQRLAEAEAAAEAERLAAAEAEAAAAVPQLPIMQSNWSVEKPFTTGADNTRIAEVTGDGPNWLRVGTEIVAVNGTPVSTMTEFDEALRASATPGDEISQPMELTVRSGGSETTVEWEPAIIQETQLANGTTFMTRFSGEVWTTSVTSVAEGETELQVGDEVIAYMSTSEPIIERETLSSIFTRELQNGTDEFSFAVSRDGSMWVASFTYNGNV